MVNSGPAVPPQKVAAHRGSAVAVSNGAAAIAVGVSMKVTLLFRDAPTVHMISACLRALEGAVGIPTGSACLKAFEYSSWSQWRHTYLFEPQARIAAFILEVVG